MLRSRIIPCLLIKDKGLVKTTKFKNPKYVGDPINAVKIFNEKEADELMVLDIDASVNNNDLDYDMIKNLALECRMPFCYGGGIKDSEQIIKILSLGVEKVALSSILFNDISIIDKVSSSVGSQSIVAVLDIKKKLLGGYNCYINNGRKKININLLDFIKEISDRGVGEIVVNSIDKDGTMSGYDYDLIDFVKSEISCPITILGGASNLDDIKSLISKYDIIGASAGSLFVFKGKYRAVLINYPNKTEKYKLINNTF